MKLVCSLDLQKKAGWTCGQVPAPTDPLDCWYASLIDLDGTDTIALILPPLRFCVLFQDLQAENWDTLNQRLVQALRTALDDPCYRIPLTVINRYIPKDTVLEPCDCEDRDFTVQVWDVMRKIWYSAGSARRNRIKSEPERVALALNNTFFIPVGSEYGFAPWQELRSRLLERYGRAAPAMELEISLDAAHHGASRTLIVSSDTSFYFLSAYLHAAYRWSYHGEHQFLLPPMQDGAAPGDEPGVLVLPPGGAWLQNRGPRLSAFLYEGADFQYRYQAKDDAVPREVRGKVRRCIPDYAEEVPVCTVCQGESPQEWVNASAEFLVYYGILCAKREPRREIMENAHGRFLKEDNAEAITKRLDYAEQWLLLTVDI